MLNTQFLALTDSRLERPPPRQYLLAPPYHLPGVYLDNQFCCLNDLKNSDCRFFPSIKSIKMIPCDLCHVSSFKNVHNYG